MRRVPQLLCIRMNNTIFSDEELALAYLERLRWPTGSQCPRCQSRASRLTPRQDSVSPVRLGVYKCSRCTMTNPQFSIRTGTILAKGKIPLNQWLQAVQSLTISAMTSRQLAVKVGISKRAAFELITCLNRCLSLAPLSTLIARPPINRERRRRPFRIPLGFEQSVRALLAVNPEHLT